MSLVGWVKWVELSGLSRVKWVWVKWIQWVGLSGLGCV